MDQLLQGNVPLRHLLYEETLFTSWRRSAIKEVNDWDLNKGAAIPKYFEKKNVNKKPENCKQTAENLPPSLATIEAEPMALFRITVGYNSAVYR